MVSLKFIREVLLFILALVIMIVGPLFGIMACISGIEEILRTDNPAQETIGMIAFIAGTGIIVSSFIAGGIILKGFRNGKHSK